MKQVPLLIIVLINFAFAACKKDPAIPPIKFYDSLGTLSVGQTGLFYLKDTTLPIELKFVRVIEDSRCPEGMQCALAGIFSIEILIDKSASIIIPNLEVPVNYKGYKIITTSATPYPKSGSIIRERDYKVEFKIAK